ELEEFRLRNSQAAQTLRSELQYFNCTPAEFKALLDAREQDSNRQGAASDLLNRSAATEEVRKVLGEDRANEFERVTDFFYVSARRVTDQQGLPSERADEAWQLMRQARTAADQLARNSSVLPEERSRQMQDLRQQTEIQLTQLLGEKAAFQVR